MGLASSKALPDKIKPFFNKRFEIIVNHKCLLWRLHVVVPEKFHSDVLHLLHNGHPGMTKMKSLPDYMFGGLGLMKRLKRLSRLVPHVHRML